MAGDNAMTDGPATDGSVTQRRALAGLILAESERNGAGNGTRLPTERQLAVNLGVSRAAIRHAMAVLQAEGRVSREVGGGTFLREPGVAGPNAATVPDPAAARAPDAAPGVADSDDYAPTDVMTVRRLFEPNAMSLVVAWATARDFAEMERCLGGGERAADHDEFEVWDAALHRSIIAATRSPLLIRLYAEVERARHGRMWGDLKRRSTSAARRDEYRRDHEEIVTAPPATRRGPGYRGDAHPPDQGVRAPPRQRMPTPPDRTPHGTVQAVAITGWAG